MGDCRLPAQFLDQVASPLRSCHQQHGTAWMAGGHASAFCADPNGMRLAARCMWGLNNAPLKRNVLSGSQTKLLCPGALWRHLALDSGPHCNLHGGGVHDCGGHWSLCLWQDPGTHTAHQHQPKEDSGRRRGWPDVQHTGRPRLLALLAVACAGVCSCWSHLVHSFNTLNLPWVVTCAMVFDDAGYMRRNI